MPRGLTAPALAAVLLLAGCGGGESEDRASGAKPRAATPKATKADVAKRLDAACKRAERRWSDPRAAARKLGPSPIQTSAPRKVRRQAEALRGYRAILQDVIDEAKRRPRPSEDKGVLERYRIELSKATTELEGDELVLRQGWDRESQAPVIRRNLRSARRFAARYGADECASLRTKPF